MLTILMLSAVLAGALLSLQPLINARVAVLAGHPAYGTLFSVLVSTLTMLVAVLVMRLPAPDYRAVAAAPPWTWVGGVIGAGVVFSALMITPRIGAATASALFIAGQLTAAVLLDHYGVLGLPEHPINLVRFLGIMFLVLGVVLIRLF